MQTEEVKAILEQHGCKLVSILSECRVLWESRNGVVRSDDVFVLRNMTEEAWKFWADA